MRSDKIPWQHGVVLVCTNQRPDGAERPSCGRARGALVKETLKKQTRAGGGPAAACRVLTTSCLDLCPADGVAVAMVPGDQLRVVDPEREGDLDALLAEVRQHMADLAAAASASAPASGEEGGRTRRLLSRLTRRD